MKIKNFILASILVLFALNINAQNLVLAENGKTEFGIVLQAQPEMNYIADLFSFYLKESTGANITISNENLKSNFISFNLSDEADIKYDGFKIIVSENGINISAKELRGLENAVHFFFEKFTNVMCYSKDDLEFKFHEKLEIPYCEIIENPSFPVRTTSNVNSWLQPFRGFHKLHTKLKEPNSNNFKFSEEWGFTVHTLFALVPPDLYFETHPEYFAYRDGHRNTEQLCLSNPEVLDIVISSLRKEIEKNPEAKYWSVSQQDNYNYCTCPACRAIDSIEGSPSGSIIRFVNKVAEAFPDKIISTLAYQYSRKPPAITKPASNVNIMLCTIECDRSRPIEADTSENSFANHIKGWGKISDDIMIWDYVVNFSNSIMPFPNFQVLQPNLKFFYENNAKIIFEQGFTTPNTDLTNLRAFLLSKLMWNVNYNTDSLIKVYCDGYYGNASPYVLEYISEIHHNLKISGNALTLYEHSSSHANDYLSPKNLEKYFLILENGLKAVEGDSAKTLRVQNVIQSVRYAYLEVCQSLPHTEYCVFQKNESGKYETRPEIIEMLDELVNHANKYGPDAFHEMGLKPNDYKAKYMAYIDRGVSSSPEKIKSISYETPNSDSYPADGPNTLIDGVYGTDNYFKLWHGWWGKDVVLTLELNEAQSVSQVNLHCIENSMSWIIPPKEVEVSISKNGKKFKKIASYTNENAGKSKEKTIVPYHIKLPKNSNTKFIKIKCLNYGKMPKWTGVIDGDTWIFVDEVEVR